MLTVPSRLMKQFFMDYHGSLDERVNVVHSCVDNKEFHPRNSCLYREGISLKHGIANARPLVLPVGGDWERRGVRTALKAL